MNPLLTTTLTLAAFLGCCLPLGNTKKALTAEDVNFPKEWHLWKGEHGKTYEDLEEELRKHLVWLGNKEYINQHNKFSNVFGYTLEMNRFGDMVGNCSS